MHVETRVSCLGILFHHSPPYVLRHTVSLESRTCWFDLLSFPQGSFCLCLQGAGITGKLPCPSTIYMGTRDLIWWSCLHSKCFTHWVVSSTSRYTTDCVRLDFPILRFLGSFRHFGWIKWVIMTVQYFFPGKNKHFFLLSVFISGRRKYNKEREISSRSLKPFEKKWEDLRHVS